MCNLFFDFLADGVLALNSITLPHGLFAERYAPGNSLSGTVLSTPPALGSAANCTALSAGWTTWEEWCAFKSVLRSGFAQTLLIVEALTGAGEKNLMSDCGSIPVLERKIFF